MNHALKAGVAVSIIVGFIAAPAWAHVPLPPGTYVDPESALYIPNPDVSQVLYYERSPQKPELWLSFDGEQPLWVEFGVPVIPGLENFEPILALVGPGLPPADADVPFTIPANKGVRILSPDPGIARGEFFERFTGTPSWDLGTWDVMLPEEGRYYLVATGPKGCYGKLWVAVGTREVFTLTDILTLPQIMRDVRAFHEVEPPLPPWFRRTMQVGVLGAFVVTVALLR